MSNNSIAYEGKVSITFTKNGRKLKTIQRHNSGCKALFTFITDCLRGNFNESNRPSYLMMYKRDDEDSSDEVESTSLGTPSLANLQYCVSNEGGYDEDSNTGFIKFKYTVAGSMLTNDVDILAMYNATNSSTARQGENNPSTFMELDSSEVIDKESASGLNIIIIWEMRFSNKQGE